MEKQDDNNMASEFNIANNAPLNDSDVSDKEVCIEVNNSDEEKKARAMLRERFLVITAHLQGKLCEFDLFDCLSLMDGTFHGYTDKFVGVSKFITPYGTFRFAAFRNGDFMYFKVKS